MIFSSTKDFFKRRSSGGYPVMESSGNITMSVSFLFASSMWQAMISQFPLRSPTVGLICARYNLKMDIFSSFLRYITVSFRSYNHTSKL